MVGCGWQLTSSYLERFISVYRKEVNPEALVVRQNVTDSCTM